jgi:hydrogenase expression/formation protein HypC
MCLSIPAKVISINENTAKVSVGGSIVNISLHLLDEVKPGDYVLVHSGFALQKLSEEEAIETINMINQLTDPGESGISL